MSFRRNATVFATAAVAVAGTAFAVTSSGGAQGTAHQSKLPHSFCFRALTGHGNNKVSRKQAQRVISGGIKIVKKTCVVRGKNGRTGARGPTGLAGPPGPAGPNG